MPVFHARVEAVMHARPLFDLVLRISTRSRSLRRRISSVKMCDFAQGVVALGKSMCACASVLLPGIAQGDPANKNHGASNRAGLSSVYRA